MGDDTFTTKGLHDYISMLTLATGNIVSGDLTAAVSVPEPATWAMMVTGFCLIGSSVRRRRPTSVAA